MKEILRSLVATTPDEKILHTENFKTVQVDRLLSLRKSERAILDHVTEFYQRHAEAPQYDTTFSHFELAQDAETVVLMEEIFVAKPVTGGSFKDLFEREVESQAAINLTEKLKNATKIATQGLKIRNQLVQGTDAAVAYVFSEVTGKPPSSDGRMDPSLTTSSKDLSKLYQDRKANPNSTYGILTGYGLIDAATAGIRKKQLYLHAGYGGHLKSTHMFNMIVNAAVDGGWNPILFTSEMPAEDVKMLMVAIHSGNPKFATTHRPLSAFRLLLGSLNSSEEDFFELVKEDLVTNPLHGDIRVIDSGEFTSFGSIVQRTVREDAETEVDQLWIDYITRLPLDAKYNGMDYTTGMNLTLADAKRFAMSFKQGEGLAVCSPFQVNREGYKKGKTTEGRLDKPALAQFNAAEKEADVISYIWYDDEERATSEPKIGLMKSRWGEVKADPVPSFIDPDCRRISDLSAGMAAVAGYSPTRTGSSGDEEVVL